MTDPAVDIADIRLKLAVMHYGIEFFHHLRTMAGVDRQSYPWDFLIEIIDDLEQIETVMRPGVMTQVRMSPLTAIESLQGLDVFCNRMNWHLKGDVSRKVEVNRFYAREAEGLRAK